MDTRRFVLSLLLVASAVPSLAAAQATDPVHARAAGTTVVDIDKTDAWTVRAPTPAIVASVPPDEATDVRLDATSKRPALTFADQQPIRPNLFDAPTAWEDEP